MSSVDLGMMSNDERPSFCSASDVEPPVRRAIIPIYTRVYSYCCCSYACVRAVIQDVRSGSSFDVSLMDLGMTSNDERPSFCSVSDVEPPGQ